MDYRPLGATGINVSLMSLGTLPLGPLQANLSPAEGAGIISHALDLGVNLLDTAELYETYPHIREALKGEKRDCLVASKSYAVTADDMERSIRKALVETGRPSIELFMLHQQESALTLKGHGEALEYLFKAREQGVIRAAGISTHHIAAVRAALEYEEIDFIFAPLNRRGLGIMDGTAHEMAAALYEAHERGKGVLIMKPLGGGHLGRDPEDAFAFLRSFPFITSIVTGVQSIEELIMDCHLLRGEAVPGRIKEKVRVKVRSIHIEDCQGCGRCVAACPSGALCMVEGRAVVTTEYCVTCGYCAPRCPEFCIKLL